MDKDRIKGKMEDAAGRIKRQAGEWTGDEKAQAEGLAEQAKGKARNAMGKMKDAADDLRGNRMRRKDDIEREERDKEAA
jgi:uncharacterized protein YjbJ (UPF0337 family)